MTTATLEQALQAALAPRDLLTHPFYQAWSAGELRAEDLARYAEQRGNLQLRQRGAKNQNEACTILQACCDGGRVGDLPVEDEYVRLLCIGYEAEAGQFQRGLYAPVRTRVEHAQSVVGVGRWSDRYRQKHREQQDNDCLAA